MEKGQFVELDVKWKSKKLKSMIAFNEKRRKCR